MRRDCKTFSKNIQYPKYAHFEGYQRSFSSWHQAARAKERQEAGNNQYSLAENLPEAERGTSRDLAASKIGMSGKTAEKAAEVVNVIDAGIPLMGGCAEFCYCAFGNGSGGCWCILNSSGRGFLSEISFAFRIASLDISRSVEGLKVFSLGVVRLFGLLHPAAISGGCWCILKSFRASKVAGLNGTAIAFRDISRSVEGLKGLFCSSFGDSVCACVLVVDIIAPLD